MRKGIKILAKVIAAMLLVAIFLPLTLALLLQIEQLQSHLAERAARMVSQKLGTRVDVGHLKVGFFNRVELDDFYVEDFDCDTLIYASRLDVSIASLGLLRGELVFDEVLLQEGCFHLRESSRGVMNIKEVVEALRPDEPRKKKNPLSLTFRRLEIEGLEFWLKRNAPRRHDYGIDWADMRLQDMWGRLSDFTISGSDITGVLDYLSGTEKSGFQIDNLAGRLYVGPGRIALDGAEILTPLSQLHLTSLDLSGNDWAEYKYFVERVNMEAQFVDSSLATDDLAYFSPSLRDWHLEARDINLEISGTVQAMTAKVRNLTTAGGSSLRADLYMRGLPNAKRTRFDVKLHSLSTRIHDARHLAATILRANLPQGAVNLLSRAGGIDLSGRFSGLLSDFTAYALASTRLGSLEGEVAMHRRTHDRTLYANLTTSNFRIGEMLGEPNFESVSLRATADGTITKDGPALYIASHVNDLIFKGRSYKSLHMQGTIVGKIYEATLFCNEPDIDFSLSAGANLSRKIPRYDLELELRKADLHAMRINERDSVSRLMLTMKGGVSLPSLDDMQGMFWISDGHYYYNNTRLDCSLMSVEAERNGENRYIEFVSPFLDATFTSPRGYKEAFQSLVTSLRSYLPALYNEETPSQSKSEKSEPTPPAEQDNARLKVRVKQMIPLTDAVAEGLEVADSTTLDLMHNPSLGLLQLKLHSNYIERKRLLAMGIDLNLENWGDSLVARGAASDLYLSKIHFQDLSLKGGVAHDRFDLESRFADSATRLAIDLRGRGAIERLDTGRRLLLEILPSNLMIGHKEWEVTSPQISVASKRIAIDRFSIHNPSEELLLEGVASPSREDSLYLSLHNFDISPLTQFAVRMGYRIDGISNGSATMKSVMKEGEILADIDMDSLRINQNVNLPPLHLASRWDFEANRAAVFIVDRHRQDTAIRGFYRPSEGRYFARAHIDSIPMKLLDPILEGVISDTRGMAMADLRLTGVRRDAQLQGYLNATNLSTKVDFTQVGYSIPEAQIIVSDNRLRAQDVEFFDSEKNTGRMNFTLDLNHLSNIAYRLDVAPRRMLVLNTNAKDNDLFYGKIYASGQARISGDKMGVKMNINASTDDNSVFYMPLSGSSNVGKAEFVTFLSAAEADTTDYLVRKRLMFESKNRRKNASGGNMDIQMELNVHPNVDFQLVIDPSAGDLMRGRGEGLLNLHINPRENVFEMMGDYQITEGSYLFTFQNLVNRKFTIERGSLIQWSGEPMDAMLNINAIFEVKASLHPLLGTTSASGNSNTRKVPVECVIHLGDRLTNPSKAFSIRVPQADSETQAAIANVLNTETTIARQFAYLLLFKNFYPENATSSSENIGAVASAATGIDLLANQFSNLLSNKYFNINFNYQPETELSSEEVDFGLSTNLVNNRLFVELEGNYMLDNKQMTNNRTSNFMGEAYITYMLDQGGNFRLRGFTQTIDRFDETQGLQETGIGIYYKEDFNNLKDLKQRLKNRFANPEKRAERQNRKAEKRADKEAEKAAKRQQNNNDEQE